MSAPLLYLIFSTLISLYIFHFQAHAAPAAPVIKQLSSILKWTARSSSKSSLSDGGNILQFEDGYLVETVVEGNQLGVIPYSIRVSQDGELFAVDSVNSNIVRITPPLSQYSRARLIAGSFQGYTGHVDGKPNDARFDHPKGVTMDDKGNVYVADTTNLAIRKIGESGVTTIAGGKSSVAGYRDGPSEDAQFSSDFDVIYVRPTCSLLVVDRGNAALRQISLNQEDCDFHDSSVSSIDLVLVIGAILIGYLVCVLQQGYGSSYFTKPDKVESDTKRPNKETLTKSQTVETVKEEQEAGWPSFSQLVLDLSKLVLEGFGNIFVSFNPFKKQGLTPLKDRLVMPEDEPVPQPALAKKHRTPTPLSETRHAHNPNEKYAETTKPVKLRSSSVKDPNKHRVSKREEYAEFYGANGEVTHVRSKSQKERTKHRVKEKRSEAVHGEQKPVDLKPVNYDDPKFSYMRNKFGDSYRYT
ncbi:putative six-bladed beta-propeller, TolB [Helianthus anomalus]